MFHRLGLKAVRWVSRHRVGAPHQLTRIKTISGDVASYSHLRTTVADNHEIASDPRRTCDGIAPRRVERRSLPYFLTVTCVERDQATIQRSDDHSIAMVSNPAIHSVTTQYPGPASRYLRVKCPQHFPASRFNCVDDTPGARYINHAIDDDWRRFEAARGTEFEAPFKTQTGHSLFVDV